MEWLESALDLLPWALKSGRFVAEIISDKKANEIERLKVETEQRDQFIYFLAGKVRLYFILFCISLFANLAMLFFVLRR